MVLSDGPVGIEWDWKDEQGNFVPGGIYLIAVSGGAGRGTSKTTAKASFAIAR
jgi:flagellar hook assembly protein FlgD